MIPWFRDYVRFSMWLFSSLWFRSRVFGADRIPASGGAMIVANHTSYLDPPLLGSLLPRRYRYLARATLGKSWIAQRALMGLGTIFVDRGAPSRASIESAIELAESGQLLVLFPEGTRSDDGRLLPFERGIELIARRASVPIVPVGIRGAHRALPRGGRFPRPAKVTIHVGEPIPAKTLTSKGGLERLRETIATLADVELAPVESNAKLNEHRSQQRDGRKADVDAATSVRGLSDGPEAARST